MEAEDELAEFGRLQAVAREKRMAYDAADETERAALLAQVLDTTEQLLAHAEAIPRRRSTAGVDELTRLTRALGTGSLVAVGAAALVTLLAPWVSVWWLPAAVLPAAGALALRRGWMIAPRLPLRRSWTAVALTLLGVVLGVLALLLAPALGPLLAIPGALLSAALVGLWSGLPDHLGGLR